MFYNLNGKVFACGATHSLPGSGFRSGFSLIETMRWQGGRIRYWKTHFHRLTESAAKLSLSLKELPETYLLFLFSDLVRKNNIEDTCVLRLQVFPSESTATCGFLIECQLPEWLHAQETTTIRTLGIAEGVIKSADACSSLKTGSRMVYALARQQARSRGWYDALLLNQYGRIAESTISNVFWIEGRQIYTPPLSEGCVAGVLRNQLLYAADVSVIEQPLTPEILQEADEVFLTNAPRGIRSIHRLGQKVYATSVTRSIVLPRNGITEEA